MRYINITETAKIIRAELRAAFPGVKFAVRSHSYSMGCNINVSWTDGPTILQVGAITDQRYGTGFDGMTDSSTIHNGDLNGEAVHFAGSRPHLSRTISKDFEDACGRAWQALSGRERFRLSTRRDFPGWPEDRPGYRLAIYIPRAAA